MLQRKKGIWLRSVNVWCRRANQAFQSKSGGWEDRKITMSPALSSECGSVTTSAPCPILVLQTQCCVYTTCGSVRKRVKARSGCAWGIPPSECAGNRAKKASVHRSSTSNKVTGRQSLSSSTKLSPGNIATRAARTKVPAQVGCTCCSPVVAEMGNSRSSVFSLWGPMSLRRLCHHLAAAGQWGREGSCRLWFAKSRLSTMTYTVWNSTRYPHWRKTYSKINSQWGCPISPVTSYSNGAVAPNLARGSPATNRALVSKLPLPWESPGRSVRSLSQNCWKSTFLGPGVRGVSAGIRVRPFPTCRHPPWEAWPSAVAPKSVSVSSPGESVGERLMYWSSRSGGIRGSEFPTLIYHGNNPKEAEAPRRCIHTGKGLRRPITWAKMATEYLAHLAASPESSYVGHQEANCGLCNYHSMGSHSCTGCHSSRDNSAFGFIFFFLHCRASTRHGRSTTGILSRKES